MATIDEQMDRLVHVENLDNMEILLTPRELDEVPFVSRLNRIHFLAKSDVQRKSCLLLIGALRHLRRILAFVEANKRADVVTMISLANWEDPQSTDPDPLIPNFWICTNAARDLVNFRLKPGTSEEARQVIDWLRSADLLETHEVFDPVKASMDPDFRRVYVAPRPSPAIAPFIVR